MQALCVLYFFLIVFFFFFHISYTRIVVAVVVVCLLINFRFWHRRTTIATVCKYVFIIVFNSNCKHCAASVVPQIAGKDKSDLRQIWLHFVSSNTDYTSIFCKSNAKMILIWILGMNRNDKSRFAQSRRISNNKMLFEIHLLKTRVIFKQVVLAVKNSCFHNLICFLLLLPFGHHRKSF